MDYKEKIKNIINKLIEYGYKYKHNSIGQYEYIGQQLKKIPMDEWTEERFKPIYEGLLMLVDKELKITKYINTK